MIKKNHIICCQVVISATELNKEEYVAREWGPVLSHLEWGEKAIA